MRSQKPEIRFLRSLGLGLVGGLRIVIKRLFGHQNLDSPVQTSPRNEHVFTFPLATHFCPLISLASIRIDPTPGSLRRCQASLPDAPKAISQSQEVRQFSLWNHVVVSAFRLLEASQFSGTFAQKPPKKGGESRFGSCLARSPEIPPALA